MKTANRTNELFELFVSSNSIYWDFYMKKIYQIIDVNINRAREGLRVVEEICRFCLNSPALSKKLKSLRHRISKTVDPVLLVKFRDSESDIGRKVSFDSAFAEATVDRSADKKRLKIRKIKDVLIANLVRSQESVRVLEEFSKLINPSLPGVYKAVRFELYDIEKKVLKKVK